MVPLQPNKYPYIPKNVTYFNLEFIKNNWMKMSDDEMAEKLEILPYVVKNVRLSFKLLKKRENFNRSKINKEEILRALTVDGYTMEEFIELKGWNITKQGLYVVLNDLKIELSILKKRKSYWHIARYIRLHPEILDENWLKKRTVKQVLKDLRIGDKFFYSLKRFLNLNTYKRKQKTVNLTCFNCGKYFKKRYGNYQQGLKNNQKRFYCQVCSAKKVWVKPNIKAE